MATVGEVGLVVHWSLPKDNFLMGGHDDEYRRNEPGAKSGVPHNKSEKSKLVFV